MSIDTLTSNVRFKLTYGAESLEFSAPSPDTNEELASTLEEVAVGLRSPAKLVVGECEKCWGFILENEPHKCEKENEGN